VVAKSDAIDLQVWAWHTYVFPLCRFSGLIFVLCLIVGIVSASVAATSRLCRPSNTKTDASEL
jgi:hypothetical protein